MVNYKIEVIPAFFLSVIDALMQLERYSMEGHLLHLWIMDKWIFLVSELEKLNELSEIRGGLNSYKIYRYYLITKMT